MSYIVSKAEDRPVVIEPARPEEGGVLLVVVEQTTFDRIPIARLGNDGKLYLLPIATPAKYGLDAPLGGKITVVS